MIKSCIMKKIFFSSISAILSVIGLSSFGDTKLFVTSYYWFGVIGSIPVTNTKPTFTQIGGQASYIGFGQQASITVSFPCSGTLNLCVLGYTFGAISGFSASGIPTGLKTVSGVPVGYKTRGNVARN